MLQDSAPPPSRPRPPGDLCHRFQPLLTWGPRAGRGWGARAPGGEDRRGQGKPPAWRARGTNYGKSDKDSLQEFENFPTDIIKFASIGNCEHSTQKPVKLLEYLVKTYTNPGDVVLDNCMGSGSTGVACVNTGRSFIGIELEQDFFNIAIKRIAKAQAES